MEPESPEDFAVSVPDMLDKINARWDALNALIDELDEHQLSEVRDPNGWAVKDHVIHLVVWERGIVGTLQGMPRHEGMGITKAQWEDDDVDCINAVIFEQHRDRTSADVIAAFRAQHEQTQATVGAMSWEDVLLPYRHYQDDAENLEDPIFFRIWGNTGEHYEEHHGWIVELLESG